MICGAVLRLGKVLPGIAEGIVVGVVVLGALPFAGCATTSTTLEKTKVLKNLEAPVAKRIDHAMTMHGHLRNDPYYWMRDDHRKNEEVLAHLKGENEYTAAEMAHTEKQQKTIFEEIKNRIKKDDSTVPYLKDGYWYYRRYEQGKEYAFVCRKKLNLEAPEEIILDINAEAEGKDYYQSAGVRVSPDTKLLAFAEDTISRRIYTVRLRNLVTGKDLEDRIEGTAGNAVWAADNKTLFYVKRDDKTLRAFQLYRHVLGTSAKMDVLVYEEKDDTFHISIDISKSKQYLLLSSDSTLVSEVQTLPANTPEADFRVFLPREKDHEYEVDHANGRFYIRTNWQAKNFRLMSAELATAADKGKWIDVVAPDQETFLADFDLFADYLVVNERRDGLKGIRIIPWAKPQAGYAVDFGEALYDADLGYNPELTSKTLRYSYSSMITPQSIIDFHMDSRKRELKKQDEVLGGYDPKNYLQRRIEISARDGEKVHVSLVFHKDLDRSKPQPLYLYGYGAYGHSMDPYFSHSRISLLDRKMIFAMAHIRGGQERGRRWYDDGRLQKKKNTFTDFIDVAQALVEKGFTSAEQLVASGGSAGGLLVGAVANMAPKAFKIVVANVPFVDVLTTMLDESIPLTTFEYDEWGNPNEKGAYHYILSYSPYDQVEAKAYPNILVLTGLHDSQVQYWEPAKWVAKLRHLKTDQNKLLFKVNMEAGHGGASGRFRRFKELALEYAFIFDVLGIR